MATKLTWLRKRTVPLPPPPTGDGLWEGRFTYAGTSRPPNLVDGNVTFTLPAAGLAYDAAAGNFLMRGVEAQKRQVARFTLPAPSDVTDGPDSRHVELGKLPRGTALSGFEDIADGLHTTYGNNVDMDTSGMLVVGDKVYWAQEPFYDQTGADNRVIGISNSTGDLTALNGVGPWKLDRYYKECARYLTLIPQAWADTHVGGKRLLMGMSGISGRQGTSMGPSAVAVEMPTAATPLDHELATERILFFREGDWTWPGTTRGWHATHAIWDCVWIEDGVDNWIVFYSTAGLESTGGQTGNPCGDGASSWSFPMKPRLLIYHADDLLPILAGTKDTWEVYPREIVELRPLFIFVNGDCIYNTPAGMTWDAANKRLWISAPKEDFHTGSSRPAVHAFDLDGGV